jgi:GNAT superfamily N-acetyltransferase
VTGLPNDFRAIVRAPLLTPSPLQKYRAGPGRHAVYDDLVLTAMGGDGPDFNNMAVLGPIAPEWAFALADAFFDTGYCVTVESETALPVEEALRVRGWALDEEEPALVLAPIPAIPPAPPGLTIQLVTNAAAFADFLAISQTVHRWVPSLRAAMDPAVALLVGYTGDEAVATARLACYGAVGEITGVVTAPTHRRRGLGTAMTWAAIAEGARRRCTAMTLTASEMGYPVYLRMGFVPVCRYRTYLPPADGEVGANSVGQVANLPTSLSAPGLARLPWSGHHHAI